MSMITQALACEHKAIMAIAKQSKYTRDFSNRIFSGEAMYERGWIRAYWSGGQVWGFTCVRHKVSEPATVLYFIGVDQNHQRDGIGKILLEDLYEQTPHKRIVLNVMKDNAQARAFYRKHGFIEVGEALEGAGVKLQKELT